MHFDYDYVPGTVLCPEVININNMSGAIK
jgi:hypothetical protein